MADTDKETAVSKAVGLGATFVTAWLAQKILARVWRAAAGHDMPKAETPGEARLGELVVAAALTGAVAYVARFMTTQGMQRFLK